MRLLVGDHLESVLDVAQKEIGAPKLVAHARLDPAIGDERVQRLQCRAAAQRWIASAGDELLRLREKFDLANAAAAELQIMAERGDLAMALEGVDLPLDRMHVGDGGEVEILAPDERRELFQKRFAGENVAGRGARLDESGALPILAHALVIGEGRLERYGDRRRAGVGTQAQIDAEHIAVRRDVGENAHHALRHFDEEIDVFGRRCDTRARAVEKDDEVDVGGVIELIGAFLAHGEEDPAAAAFRNALIIELELAGGGGLAQREGDGRSEGGVGEARERGGCVERLPGLGEIGERDEQRALLLGAAQRAHQLRLFRDAFRRALRRLDETGEAGVRIVLEQARETGGVAGGKLGEIGRGAEGALEQRARLVMRREDGGERAIGVALQHARQRGRGLRAIDRLDNAEGAGEQRAGGIRLRHFSSVACAATSLRIARFLLPPAGEGGPRVSEGRMRVRAVPAVSNSDATPHSCRKRPSRESDQLPLRQQIIQPLVMRLGRHWSASWQA